MNNNEMSTFKRDLTYISTTVALLGIIWLMLPLHHTHKKHQFKAPMVKEHKNKHVRGLPGEKWTVVNKHKLR